MLIVFFLGLIAGAALQLQQSTLWQGMSYLACTAFAPLVLAVYGLRDSWLVRVSVFVLALLLAFGVTGWRASHYLQATMDPLLEGVDIELVGVVAAMPQRLETGLRFRFEVEAAYLTERAVRVPPVVLMSWYTHGFSAEGASFNLEQASAHPKAGERWQFTARLKAPHGNVNPHGFDYELWMWEQGAGALGYVRNMDRQNAEQLAPRRVGQVSWNLSYSMERARQVIRDKVFEQMARRQNDAGASAARGVLAALIVGDQNVIERSDWDIFRATGVAHLMSISGLHITMFAWLASGLIGWAWRKSAVLMPRLCLSLPATHAGLIGGLVLAGLYAWFSGWGVPAQRTIWMLATFSSLRWLGLGWPWYATWLLAAVVVLSIDPWAMLQPGFWLSFVAVAVLFSSDPKAAPPLADGTSPLAESGKLHTKAFVFVCALLREQFIITLALAPLTLLLFQQVSLVGLLANAVAIPLITLIVTPLAMLGVGANPLWDVAAFCVSYLATLLKWLAAVPYGVYTAPAPPFYLSVLAVLGGVLLVLQSSLIFSGWTWFSQRPSHAAVAKTLLVIALLSPAFFWQPSRPVSGQFELLAIDVGQGNAVLIRTRTHSLLFDAGPRFSRESDAGHRTIIPLLRALGESLDVLMLSHKDSDHTGGAKAILAMQPNTRVITSVYRLQELRALGLPMHSELCFAGQTWTWDGVRFDVLHPKQADLEASKNIKPNAISCVLKITNADAYKPQSALLTADIEMPQEQALLDMQASQPLKNQLASTVLLVPHHGSKTSSSELFLDAVNPKIAIVQAGYRNRFGHPRPQVMARYVQREIKTVESSSCGAAKWTSLQPDEVACQRDIDRRYWQHMN